MNLQPIYDLISTWTAEAQAHRDKVATATSPLHAAVYRSDASQAQHKATQLADAVIDIINGSVADDAAQTVREQTVGAA